MSETPPHKPKDLSPGTRHQSYFCHPKLRSVVADFTRKHCWSRHTGPPCRADNEITSDIQNLHINNNNYDDNNYHHHNNHNEMISTVLLAMFRDLWFMKAKASQKWPYLVRRQKPEYFCCKISRNICTFDRTSGLVWDSKLYLRKCLNDASFQRASDGVLICCFHSVPAETNAFKFHVSEKFGLFQSQFLVFPRNRSVWMLHLLFWFTKHLRFYGK